METNAIIQLILLVFPGMSLTLASVVSYLLAVLIGAAIAVPSVLFWVRKNLPTLIAFLVYVYDQTNSAKNLKKEDKKGYQVPLAGIEKRELVIGTLSKELLNPDNQVVTKKSLSLFKKIFKIAGGFAGVVDFVVPIMKRIRKK